ncbi:MAG: ABC transporter permease subunit, partial [Chitinophagaceae bacterium]|nr:ABC transporter permease subunit [Chitinophagaceae bacterium]
MKKVISIARVELAGMFYSPIAWIALILFIIQVGMDFSDKLIDLEAMQFIGRSTSNLTNVIFSEDSLQKGLLRLIQERMFLFIPLLTMGSMSREIHSGSIKLLLSSPIRLSGIIMGKFLAMMVIGLLFIIILLLYMLAGIFTIENMDWPSVMVALLGIYLLICAYAAIGIFISSLTRYQIMAAISTFILLGVLSYMGRIWQKYDFFREVTHNISISGRLNAFIDGLIITREVIYFLGIIAFFLSLTMLRLWFDRKSASISMRVAGYSLLCAALIIVGFISSRPVFTGYWDFTSTQRNTMSEDGQKMIKRLNGPLEITTYANLFDSQFDDVSPASRYK